VDLASHMLTFESFLCGNEKHATGQALKPKITLNSFTLDLC